MINSGSYYGMENFLYYIFKIISIVSFLIMLVLLVISIILVMMYWDAKKESRNSSKTKDKTDPLPQMERDSVLLLEAEIETKEDSAYETEVCEVTLESDYDELTGVYNRNYFYDVLNKGIQIENSSLTVIYGDINGLRRYNQIYGYNEGDKQIINTVKILNEVATVDTKICRVSGAEFVLVVPDIDSKTGELMCAEIREKIKQDNSIQVDVALGISTKKYERFELHKLLSDAENSMIRNKMLSSSSSKSSLVFSLLNIMDEKSHETEEHALRMQEYAVKIAKSINLPESEINNIILLSVLHDIGKVCIADDILLKPGKLDEREWEIMKQHCLIGSRILKSSPELSAISEAVLCHHENWEGTGYPQGLRGEQIPLISRIIRVVDSFDAMTNNRVYSRAKSLDEARAEIINCAGSHFDPYIVNVFIEVLEEEEKNNAA